MHRLVSSGRDSDFAWASTGPAMDETRPDFVVITEIALGPATAAAGASPPADMGGRLAWSADGADLLQLAYADVRHFLRPFTNSTSVERERGLLRYEC